MQSVELLLDPATDTRVRDQWQLLVEAGLPSQARHTGPTNAPHVTLAVRDAVDLAAEPRLREVAATLPLPVRLGPVAVFGRHRYVLVLLLVVDTRLLALHAAVAAALGRHGLGDPLTEPGRWTPHVTLARGLGAVEVGRALEALGGGTPVEGGRGLPPLGLRDPPGLVAPGVSRDRGPWRAPVLSAGAAVAPARTGPARSAPSRRVVRVTPRFRNSPVRAGLAPRSAAYAVSRPSPHHLRTRTP